MPFEITNMEWTILAETMEFLRPFDTLTLKMSSEANVTASMIIPAFNNLFDHFDSSTSNVNALIKDAAEEGFEKLKKYYSKTTVVTMTLTFLDPRYRMKYFIRRQFPAKEIRDLEK